MAENTKDLPLHDEAAAREKWRGGETIIRKGSEQGLPASEVDNAAQPSGGDASVQRVDLRPPD